MGAEYSFVSVWRVPASAERCWAEIVRMLSPGAATWWPAMTVPEPPRTIARGETMTFAVRSPLGYRLRVRLTLTGVDEGRRIVAASEGDLRGSGSVEVRPAGDAASVVTFHWDVATERAWMNATVFVLRPVFELAHAHVMRQGEKGMRAALATS